MRGMDGEAFPAHASLLHTPHCQCWGQSGECPTLDKPKGGVRMAQSRWTECWSSRGCLAPRRDHPAAAEAEVVRPAGPVLPVLVVVLGTRRPSTPSADGCGFGHLRVLRRPNLLRCGTTLRLSSRLTVSLGPLVPAQLRSGLTVAPLLELHRRRPKRVFLVLEHQTDPDVVYHCDIDVVPDPSTTAS